MSGLKSCFDGYLIIASSSLRKRIYYESDFSFPSNSLLSVFFPFYSLDNKKKKVFDVSVRGLINCQRLEVQTHLWNLVEETYFSDFRLSFVGQNLYSEKL